MNRRNDVGSDVDEIVAAGFLSRAVALALDNAVAGQLPFGALVIRDGTVVATGVNTALRDHDPTAHAEISAIRTDGAGEPFRRYVGGGDAR